MRSLIILFHLPNDSYRSVYFFQNMQQRILVTTATNRSLKEICMCGRICPRDDSWCVQQTFAINPRSTMIRLFVRDGVFVFIRCETHSSIYPFFVNRILVLLVPISSARNSPSFLLRDKSFCIVTYVLSNSDLLSRLLCPSSPFECDPPDSRIRDARCQAEAICVTIDLRQPYMHTRARVYTRIYPTRSQSVFALPALMEVQ